MGSWKKAVAAIAALPMLMTIVPSATAADASSSAATAQSAQSQTAQQALQQAVAQNAAGAGGSATPAADATPAASADLLANLDFNDVKAGATGSITDATTGVKATINGKAATGTGKDGTTAAQLGSGFWLDVTKSDGSAVLKGKDAVTISYDSKSASTGQGWSFYAAPDAKAPVYKSEHYLGVMDLTTSLTFQRYNNDGSGRNESGSVAAKDLKNDWRHVDIVLAPTSSTLYIDGEQAATATPDGAVKQGLADILGADGGVLQLGKANWVNGEYYSGLLDNLKIYGSAHTADQIKKDYEAGTQQTKQAEADANALTIPNAGDVRSSITLPTTGTVNGSAISWKSSDANVVTDQATGGNGEIPAGVVTRQKADTKVTLTATVTGKDGSTATKTFDLTVKAAVEKPKTTDYLFAHFTGTERNATDEQMYFATSKDGLTWHDTRAAGDPVLTSDLGEKGVRDPYLVRSPEGDHFYLIATDLSIYHRGGWGDNPAQKYNGSKDLIVWESDDLVNWGEPYAVDVASKIPHAAMAWAPEAYWIPELGQYMVYWATTSDQDDKDPSAADPTNMYYSLTRDFKTFGTPVKWIDRPQSVIDTTMLKADDGYYYRVSGDTELGVERTKNPLATTFVGEGDGYNHGQDDQQWEFVGYFRDLVGNSKWTGKKLEGPELFRYNDDDVQTTASGKTMLYGLMWDQYAEGKGYLPFYSADLGSTDTADWAAASKVNFGSLKKRHGTILPITAAEYEAVTKAFDENQPLEPVTPDKSGSKPIASYDFEDDDDLGKDTTGNGNDLTLNGVKEFGKPGDWGSKVIQLRGDGGYAELPTGLFDGRNEFTLEFSSKSRQTSGNFFSFALGQDNNKYLFIRLRGNEAYVAITKGSYQSEEKISGAIDTQTWHKYTLTVTAKHIALYVDGELAGQVDTDVAITDFGRNTKAYFGKSFYSADGTYNGGIDDVNVYNYAKSALDVQGPAAALKVKKTDQILSQNATTATDGSGAVAKTIVLDYWSDAKTGAKSDKSKVSFDYEIPDGVTVADESGKTLTAADLDKITDYSQPLKLKLAYDGKTVDYTVGVEVLVTPVRISGDEAKASGIGEKDPTGNEGWKFFADPQVVAYGGKYYIFPTTDGYSGWAGHSIHVFESSDMVNWEDRGTVVDLSKDYNDMIDGRKEKAWAPGFAVRNGKFYLYFSGGGMTNVAISDPAKGGTITSGYKIQKVKVESSIDPAVFQDPNEPDKYYLAWGQSPGKYAELNDDMTGIKAGTTVTTNATKDMREGSYITSRPDPNKPGNTIYYYSYSCWDTNEPRYSVGYAYVSAKKLSDVKGTDWQYGGYILSKDDAKGILGTAHHSFVQIPGTDDWYVVYHAFLTDEMRPRGYDSTHNNAQLANGNKREIRIARVTYGADGKIETIPVTYEGVLPETTPSVSVTGAVAGSGDSADAATPVGTKLTAAFNDGWKLASVQWYRADSADAADVAKAVAIDGATAAEYTLTDADAGKTVFAKAIGENTTGVLQNAQPGTAGVSPSKTFELATVNTVKVAAKPATVPVESVTIAGDGVKDGKVTVKEGASVALKATVSPADADDADVAWTTSNAAVATVDANGKVTGVKVGTATITATAGGKTASVTVTVTAKGGAGDNGAGDNGAGDGSVTKPGAGDGAGAGNGAAAKPTAKPSGNGAALSKTGAAVASVLGVVAVLAAAGAGLFVWRKRRA